MIVNLVSTIIPVHNRPEQLREAVRSVIAQSYRPIEVIIVDDGSTDETAQVAEELAAGNPLEIRVVHQANRGPGAAREAGRLQADGEFIQYLDSDDVLLPEKFSRQVAVLRAAPECGVSYGWTRYRHADGREEQQPWKGSGDRIGAMFPSFLQSRWWDTPTPLYRRSIVDAAGPWADLRIEEDWEYDCRIAAMGVRLSQVEAFVAEVRDHGESRLCRGEEGDPERLAARARAHELIFGHAVRAGIGPEVPEMRHFLRELFLLARQCGAAGLAVESQRLVALARQGAERSGLLRIELAVYRVAAACLGWSAVGRLACESDRLRR